MHELKVCTRDSDHCVATWGPVLIQVWRYTPTRQAVLQMVQVADMLIGAQPSRRIFSIGVVERTSPAPNREARDALVQFHRSLVPHVTELIVVPLGGPLRGAVIRGVGVALSSLTTGGLRFRFVDSTAGAAALVAPLLPAETGGAPALDAALQAARVIANTASADKPWIRI